MKMRKLTPKQEKFCQEYVNIGNKSEAYRRAYNASNMGEATINVNASNMDKNPIIHNRIKELKKAINNNIHESSLIPIDRELFKRLRPLFSSIKEFRDWVSYVVAKESINEGFCNKEITRFNINSTARYSILERAGFKCQACGDKPSKNNDVSLQIDHIIPFSLGGADIPENYQVLCRECNISKGNRSVHNHNTEEYFK